MKIYIVNPDNGKLATIEDWLKEENPTRAEFIAIKRDGLRTLILHKNYAGSGGCFNFANAQKRSAEVLFNGEPMRCPTRKECIDIYDARFAGLDEAGELIGGDPTRGYSWTCEKDSDPEYYANTAWFFGGTIGTLDGTNVNSAYRCQAVTLSDLD